MSARPIRSVTDVLGLISRGRFAERLDEELEKCITALESLPEEKGTASIEITLTLNYQSGRLDIRPKVNGKPPKEKAFSDTPFWVVDGALSVQHPSQIDMFAGPRDAAERREREAG